ncbi:fimbrial protein [Aeromonas hydrophila]|uniref:fimbrial protein n=1 Tax=Aeromonas hydrophila TaxID=644 RepID=UPI0009567655|nr:fimbrial protein [Aeromonas hydrophila]SIR38895.1 Fimbrial protein [Aeromonas hydrophila]SIR53189.1 Fimbrial protein [Aeromonas hydrophila]
MQTTTTVTLNGTADSNNPAELAVNDVTGIKARLSGVGVQLSVKGSNNLSAVVASLGRAVLLGQLLASLSTFSMGAQYIQTDAPIRAGKADTSATLTITYQ